MSHVQSAPPRQGPVLGLRALEVVLVVTLWVEAAFAVLRLLGPSQLGFGSERATQHVPLGLRLLASLYLLVPNRTLGADVVFGSAGFRDLGGAVVPFQQAPLAARVLLACSGLLRTAIVLSVTYLLLLMVRSLRAGDPFTESNSRRIVLVALLVAVGGEAAVLMDTMAVHLVTAGGQWLAGWSHDFLVIDLHPLAYGLVLAVIAAVFRHGVELRKEVQGLV